MFNRNGFTMDFTSKDYNLLGEIRHAPNSYNACRNRRIVIKDEQEKSYQDHIEG